MLRASSLRPVVLAVVLGLCAGVAAAAEERPLRIAAPGLRPAGLDAATADQVTAAFARELEAEGLQVTTANQIAERIGQERRLQLLGCEQEASSCLAEIASALDADAVLTGSVAKIGSRYLANVKVLSPGGGVLAVLSRAGSSVEDLLGAMAEGSRLTAADVFKALGRAPPADARRLRESRRRPNHLSAWVILLASGAYALEYERALTPHLSVTASPVWVFSVPANDTHDVGFEVVLGGRAFPFGSAPEGLWVAGELQVGYGTRTPLGGEASSGVLVAPGLSVGYTLSPAYGVTFSAGLGAFRHLTAFQFSDGLGEWFQFIPRLNVGYLF